MPPTVSRFDRRGPFAVGALQTRIHAVERPLEDDPLEIAASRASGPAGRVLPCEIWYPAAGPDTGLYDAPHPLSMRHQASLGLDPIDAACGVLAFSHGNSGFRQQSTFLMTHLASWGFVVIAPDHVGNTFFEMLELDDEARIAVHRRARAQRPHDLAAALRALLDDGLHADELPPLAPDRVGALGHSFGGWTSLKLPALERRLRAVCALAPVSEPFVGRKAFASGELPLRPGVETLVLAAREDTLVDLDTSLLPLAERLGPKALLEIIDGADHFHFCDGLEQLHKMHENTPRPKQKRATLPLSALQSEGQMHPWLNERISRFFHTTLGGTSQ